MCVVYLFNYSCVLQLWRDFLGPAGVGSADCCLLPVTQPLSTGILLNSCSNYVSKLFCVISKSYVLYTQFIFVTGSFSGFRQAVALSAAQERKGGTSGAVI